MLTRARNFNIVQAFGEFLHCNPVKENERYVKGAIISALRADSAVAVVDRYVLQEAVSKRYQKKHCVTPLKQ